MPGVIVVGTGFGLRVHVPAFRAAGFEVRALVGTDRERTQRRADRLGVPLAFDDLGDALATADAEIVTIATPPGTHHDLVLAAAAAGRAVLCEKPLAATAAEADRMIEACERAGVLAVVGNEFRWDPAVDALTTAIREGSIGAVRDVLVARAYPIFADPGAGAPSWWFDGDTGGGWLAANGSHLIDQIEMWTGGIEQVDAVLHRATGRGDGTADTGYQVQFSCASGATGLLHENAAAWGEPFEITRVVGDRGTLWIDGGTCWIADHDGCRALPPRLSSPADAGSEAPGEKRPWTGAEIAAYTQLAGWLRAALAAEPLPAGPSPATLADGARVMQVIDAARRSDRERRWVPVNGRTPSIEEALR